MYGIPVGGIKEGDRVEIEFETVKRNHLIVQYMAMGDRYSIYNYIVVKGFVSMLACAIILILILLNVITTHMPILIEERREKNSLKWLTTFLVIAALYLSANSGCMEFFLKRLIFVNWLNSFSVLILPMPLIIFTQNAYFPNHKRYNILCGLNFIMAVASLIAYIGWGYNLEDSLIYAHIIILSGATFCLISIAQEQRNIGIETIVGSLAILSSAAMSVTAYWTGAVYPESTMFGYGMIVFSVCMFIRTVKDAIKIKKIQIETERRAMQTQKEAAEIANKRKSQFLSHMSHEIRTPLNAILGMNELIIRETGNQTVKKHARDAQNAGKVLLALINDILDLSKIETGKMDIVCTEYSLSGMLHDAILLIAERAKNKNLEFKINIDESIPDLLYGDEVRIKQIIVNMLTNAVKYTDEGWCELKVIAKDTDIENDSLTLEITVSDSGIGIKEEDIPKLTEEFERFDAVKNKNVEGTGLGMNITMSLIKLMNGELTISSKYNEGSSFKVVIPQTIVDAQPIGDYKKRFDIYSDDEIADENELTTYPGKVVFVVDDNETNIEVITSILELLEITVYKAENGQKALEYLDRNNVDLILTDDMMPVMNGTELMKYLKSHTGSASNTTPIVVLTANAMAGNRETYIQSGFDDYLAKPIDIDSLQRLLAKFLT